MKRAVCLVALALCWVPSVFGAGGGNVPVAADGIIQFEPPQVRGCVAVRIEVPADKMVVGIRWYSGSAAGSLPKILAGTGSGEAPSSYVDAVTVAEEVQGQNQGWSVVEFTVPVASESGTLFIVVEYPAGYVAPAEGPAVGVGYAMQEATYPYYVTGDGESWIRMSSRCRVLLEPILADRVPGVVALRGPELSSGDIPLEKLGLNAAPNPFNPQTTIALYLKQATTGDIAVYDVRGRRVVELYRGILAQGESTFVWDGRDAVRHGVASGAYWVQARTGDQTYTTKVMLLR